MYVGHAWVQVKKWLLYWASLSVLICELLEECNVVCTSLILFGIEYDN